MLDAAKKNDARKVDKIFIEVGELTALNPDQLKFIFETITIGTVAEGARYNIKVIKPIIRCKKCSYEGTIEIFERLHFFIPVIRCPECSEFNVEIIAGRESYVKKIKIS